MDGMCYTHNTTGVWATNLTTMKWTHVSHASWGETMQMCTLKGVDSFSDQITQQYAKAPVEAPVNVPVGGNSNELNLENRVQELETKLNAANGTIASMQQRIDQLEA